MSRISSLAFCREEPPGWPWLAGQRQPLRLEVIAEGIESEIQRDLLTSMGCQFGQGYLLPMPMPAGQAETLARIGSHLMPSLPRQAPVVRPGEPSPR